MNNSSDQNNDELCRPGVLISSGRFGLVTSSDFITSFTIMQHDSGSIVQWVYWDEYVILVLLSVIKCLFMIM